MSEREAGACRRRAVGALAVALLLAAGCATQRVQVPAWPAAQIEALPATHVRLLAHGSGTDLGVIEVARVRRVSEVVRRIGKAAGVTPELRIVGQRAPNAYASPAADGRHVVGITVGMLDLLGDDEPAWAFVVGHELAHIRLRHGETRRERESTRTNASNIVGLVLSAAGVPLGDAMAEVATRAVARAYTRDEEREADRHGVDLAVDAGFDAMGAVRAWERMSDASDDGALTFLSTHPSNQERLEALRQRAARGRWE